MIYTSYFGALKRLPEGAVVVSIARYSPRWFRGSAAAEFAPPADLLAPGVGDAEFDKGYRDRVLSVLSDADVERVLSSAVPATRDGAPVWESQTDHVVLTCYEADPLMCHRSALARELSSRGYPCEEYRRDAELEIEEGELAER